MLIEQGVPVFERLRVSPACPLILASHVALDRAREKAQGANAIGTTGRGIGPAYEDKVARRAVRVADLFHRERFAAKLGEILDYHNFVLQRYFNAAGGRFPAGRSSRTSSSASGSSPWWPTSPASSSSSRRGPQRAVRGRAGRDARRRSRHLSVRDLLDHHGGRRGGRHRPRSAALARGARHRQGLRHARRRRAVSDRAVRRARRALVAASATSSVRSPDGSAAAAGSMRSRCAARSCTRAARRCASPSSTCSTGSTRSASAWAIGSTAPSVRTPPLSVASSSATARPCTRSCRAGRNRPSGSRDYEELPVQCAAIPRAPAGAGGRAGRYHLHRSRSGADGSSKTSVCMSPQALGPVPVRGQRGRLHQ